MKQEYKNSNVRVHGMASERKLGLVHPRTILTSYLNKAYTGPPPPLSQDHLSYDWGCVGHHSTGLAIEPTQRYNHVATSSASSCGLMFQLMLARDYIATVSQLTPHQRGLASRDGGGHNGSCDGCLLG